MVNFNNHDKNHKDSHILINLSSLTITNLNGKRMWTKPIKGLYTT